MQDCSNYSALAMELLQSCTNISRSFPCQQCSIPYQLHWYFAYWCPVSICHQVISICAIECVGNACSGLQISTTCAFWMFNSLAPRKFEWNFRWVIFVLNLVIDGWCISGKIALRWMPLSLADDKSTLVQVMAWCRQSNGDQDLCCHMVSLGHNELKAI